jgi:hypothetical protein
MSFATRLAVLVAAAAASTVAAHESSQKPLTLSEPSHHVFDGRFAREPMLVEHPTGVLFVSGYGRPLQPTDLPPNLWKSVDRGKTWSIVDVGSFAQGAHGNSDVDLAVARGGTLYFITMTYDAKLNQGTEINVGVSRDIGTSWTWTRLSQTPFDDRPWVDTAPDGTAHVIWNDGQGVNHALSTDDGRTWTERSRIHTQGGSSHLAVGPKGEVAVRITPHSASGFKEHPDADFIAVSVDAGKTWQRHPAPGRRTWTPMKQLASGGLPRWVEPVAWDAAGALYSLWTDPARIHLARSADRGMTWRQWVIGETTPAAPFFPYLVAGKAGELAATWFTAQLPGNKNLRTHVARITVNGNARPEVAAAPPFTFEAVNASGNPQTAGEYVPVTFLEDGTLAIVTALQNVTANRLGFSWWIAR